MLEVNLGHFINAATAENTRWALGVNRCFCPAF
jgi:hypothetical protein